MKANRTIIDSKSNLGFILVQKPSADPSGRAV